MNTKIENFFAAQSSNVLSNDERNVFRGVVAYATGFFYAPRAFFNGEHAVIVDSAKVDAGVTAAEMASWLEENSEKISAAARVFRHNYHEPQKCMWNWPVYR